MDDRERERLRRRRDALQSSRKRKKYGTQEPDGGKAFLLFRTYVTIIIVGIALAISFFHTEYTKQWTQNMKKAIAYQVPVETLKQTGGKVAAWWEQTDIAVFQERTKQKKQSETEPMVETNAPEVETFQPDLPEDEDLP